MLAVESSLTLNPRLLALIAKRVGNMEEHEVGPKVNFLVRDIEEGPNTDALSHN